MSSGRHQHAPIVLRPATPEDAAGIAHIEHVSFAHPGERFGQRRIRYLIGSPRAMVTVAEADGRALGWAAGLIGAVGHSREGRIYAIAVDPEARGRKLGQRLLVEMIAALRKRGAGRITLEVRSDNHVAINLYQRMGFTPGKSLAHFYGRDVHGMRMSLDPLGDA